MNQPRQQLEQFLAATANNPGPVGGRTVTCPCCGFPLLTGRATGQICDLCNWEDDGSDDASAEKVNAANAPITLAQARAAFARYGVMYHPADDPRIGGADSQEETELKQAIVAAFEQINPQTTPEQLDEIYTRVDHLLERLDVELKKKILAYEARQRKGPSDIE